MQHTPSNLTDPGFIKPQKYNRLDKFFLRLIRDERDLPFIYFSFNIIFFLIPYALILFSNLLTGWYWLAAAVIYMVINAALFIGRFALMFHSTAHRTLFKKQYNYLNYVLPYVVAPFFGHMADTYYAHHIGMHHAENNLEEDESSTMSYQRDSLRSFLLYLFMFMIRGIYDLAAYFKRKNRKKLMYSAVRGEILFIIFCIILSCFNWPTTFCVFIFTYFFYRLIAMLGNWAQHAFIDPGDPGNAYKNSMTCINSRYNWQCWNDGYHISHHLKPTMHWTEHPAYFEKTIDKYINHNAVVFSKIDIMMVAVLLLAKRYDVLARNFVNIGNRFSSEEEVITFLKERTAKIRMNFQASVENQMHLPY
ncbi:fatty acid desaturase [Pedobacter sp. MC2016-15]|uniref:fatty acid desaturase family protein n=1 Tax=Pedobacter sp. MC2016-15 TaxID=2994473 RepID=UPI0022481A41|nr:fatty acid desaturase [Pedobacter sp. MC2016-15]MCX2481507.1 fatty acid desaturase [Pedobacter sp. MC2016-15]